MQRFILVIVIMAWIVVGCTAPAEPVIRPAIGSCSLQVAATAADEEAITAVLMAEGKLVVEQNIDGLMNLWREGSEVVDAKNTPDNGDDDQRWMDKDAIRNRYVRIVFPGAPTQADPKDLQIQISGEQATITATTHIGNEVSPAGDRWVLVKQNNCWAIQSLTYNLEQP